MNHPIYRVRSVKIIGPYMLQVGFDDGTTQTINFRPVLAGELYGPLRDLSLFNQVRIDPEVQTLVWPNGADFDPTTLHDWPEHDFFAALTSGQLTRYDAYDESRADFSRWKGVYETWLRRKEAYTRQLQEQGLADVLRVQPAY